MSQPTGEQPPPDLEQLGRAFREAFQPFVDHVRRVWDELQPALRQIAEAVERGELVLEPAPPEPACHCLCALHREAGWFCASVAIGEVPLTGRLGVTQVPMCLPCGRWWINERSGRLASAR